MEKSIKAAWRSVTGGRDLRVEQWNVLPAKRWSGSAPGHPSGIAPLPRAEGAGAPRDTRWWGDGVEHSQGPTPRLCPHAGARPALSHQLGLLRVVQSRTGTRKARAPTSPAQVG